MKILITGAAGQLGRCFQHASKDHPKLEFTFTTSEELDLSQFAVVGAFMRRHEFDYCINCAAYTNVEQAEKEQEMAYLINAESVRNLAEACEDAGTVLVHFSTDYVFDGRKSSPYLETDPTGPLNVYGASKLLGEQYIQDAMTKFFVFRTSWLYSDMGKNFFNTIKSKVEAGEQLNITSAQKGSPTNAYDLAAFVLNTIGRKAEPGIYHYSNLGEATWFDFAQQIVQLMGSGTSLVENNDFKTLAVRPDYSVLSKEKALQNFKLPIADWRDSLKRFF